MHRRLLHNLFIYKEFNDILIFNFDLVISSSTIFSYHDMDLRVLIKFIPDPKQHLMYAMELMLMNFE